MPCGISKAHKKLGTSIYSVGEGFRLQGYKLDYTHTRICTEHNRATRVSKLALKVCIPHLWGRLLSVSAGGGLRGNSLTTKLLHKLDER